MLNKSYLAIMEDSLVEKGRYPQTIAATMYGAV